RDQTNHFYWSRLNREEKTADIVSISLTHPEKSQELDEKFIENHIRKSMAELHEFTNKVIEKGKRKNQLFYRTTLVTRSELTGQNLYTLGYFFANDRVLVGVSFAIDPEPGTKQYRLLDTALRTIRFSD
ncbi:MAG: hypothetical protein IID45_12520, partial [Planctomycetes bacterium]|nr:hypothetical protein [Planctomycetota bacterium]